MTKTMRKERISKRKQSVKWQACTNLLIPSLLLKAYSLPEANDFFGHKPFGLVSLKVINFYNKIFLRNYSH